MSKNYLMIENSIVTNIVLWDGGDSWIPPKGAIMLVQADTPALIWIANSDKTDFTLTEVLGAGDIGFSWDGTICKTNQPKPTINDA